MSEAETLFTMEVDHRPSFHEQMMNEYRTEVSTMTTDELEALRGAELDSLSDTEARVYMLNNLIDGRR